MDPNYAMAKFGLESKNILQTKNRSCWYYTKYFFFFLSIIQFLIILGLVLFMLYGNAHVGTENRLMSVEERYKNLTLDHTWLKGNFSQLKAKLTSLEKENQNCSNLLATAIKQLQIRNVTARPPLMPMPHSPEICRPFQIALERFNTTYIIETLQLKHTILTLERENERQKESCQQKMFNYTSHCSKTISEKETLQKEKESLEQHFKRFQTDCTTIDKKFDSVLDNMVKSYDRFISSMGHSQYTNCWSISNEINKNIDQTIVTLRQQVNSVIYESSRLTTEKDQARNNFMKCDNEKMTIISEKNGLLKEKGGLEKELKEKTDELTKFYVKYMKKEEDLEICRKMQPVGRVSGGIYPRI